MRKSNFTQYWKSLSLGPVMKITAPQFPSSLPRKCKVASKSIFVTSMGCTSSFASGVASFVASVGALISFESVNSIIKFLSSWAFMALHVRNSILNSLSSTLQLTTLLNMLILCRTFIKGWSDKTMMWQAWKRTPFSMLVNSLTLPVVRPCRHNKPGVACPFLPWSIMPPGSN